MSGILITRPNHDQVTHYLSKWSEPVIIYAKGKGKKVLDLLGKRANQNLFRKYLNSSQPGFVFLNGHGSPDLICGYNDEILLDKNISPALIHGSIIYARSCNAGEKLGPTLITKGTKAFIGYAKPFSFAINNDFITRPTQDFLAKLFLEPSNLLATSIIKGKSAQESHGRSIAAMKKTLSNMISSNLPNKKDFAFALYNNILGQVLLGDPQSKVS